MKKLFLALAFVFIAGCATNGGPFDSHFWIGKQRVVTAVVEDKVEEVVDVVTTPDPKDRKSCKKAGGVWKNHSCKLSK